MSENTDNTEVTQDLLATLKQRADRMGISYHPSIGVEKLREKINAALGSDGPAAQESAGSSDASAVAPAPAVASPAPVVEETLAQKRKRLKMEATALIRIRLTCMNPAKKEWDGEIITVGNSLVGTVKKYIPFNAEEGWHVPKIMLEQLQARQCQVFHTLKTKNGVSIRKGKLIKEFAIEILPPLTQDELHDLAQRQAMARQGD